jgi:hypothetical protein
MRWPRLVVKNDGADAQAGSERPTRTLWVLSKDGHSMTCVISGEPGHEELQLLLDGQVYVSESHTVHDGAVGRATTLHRGFEERGWRAV